MKKISLLIVLVLIITAFAACSKEEENPDIPEGFKRATNDGVDYYFNYPENWTLDRNDGGLVKVIAPSGVSTATTAVEPSTVESVTVRDISNVTATTFSVDNQFTSIESYFDNFKEEFEKSFTDFAEIGERETDENTGALTVCYKGTVAGIEYKYYQKMVYVSGNVYNFTFTAPIDYYDSHIDDVKSIFDSINFKK